MSSPLETVKAALKAYVDKDRAAIEALIADDYTFTSPLDNAINRDTYFAICWPNSENCEGFDFIAGSETGDTAFILYEGIAPGAKRFRNSEFHRVRGGKLVATEVYFGWNVPHPVASGAHQDDDASGGNA